jgi:NADH dehydrogenase [ubiquinone] 1 alpha subcomplex assembly factor 7
MVDPQSLPANVTPLDAKIRDRIKDDGPLTVSEFMRVALGDPKHGYYRTRDPLGEIGDFITSPEISQVFGEIIGLWCAVTWQNTGAPKNIHLVELGPGRGSLMADILRTTQNVMPAFTDTIDVHLVETGKVLQQQQQQALTGYHVDWHDQFETIPPGPVLVIANEFFDALPIDQYIMTAEGWQERRITIDQKQGNFLFEPCDLLAENNPTIPIELGASPINSIFECSPTGEQIAGDIAKRIATDGGAALIIDYGHVRHGLGDTLQAVKSHKYHYPLATIGEADLTAHIDFAALRDAAKASGATVHGPVFQGEFLKTLGIEQRTEVLAATASPDQTEILESACRRLIAADGMGTLFKAMAITSATDNTPAGFEGNEVGSAS